MTFDKMFSKTEYIKAKHFTNPKYLELEDMASMTIKVIFVENALIYRKLNLRHEVK